MNHFVPSTKGVVRSFRLAPKARHRLNQIRLYVDLIGVTLVRLCLPLVHNPLGHTLLSVYNVAAWITILTVDSTRIPEAGTTRIQQRKSWRYALRFLPLLCFVSTALVLGFHQPLLPSKLSIDKTAYITIGSYLDEMLFRNTLQPKLRQWGLSLWLAIGIQSVIYAFAVWLGHASLPVVLSFWVLGLVNGWMVYRFRSMWAAFLLGLAWNGLWLG